MAAKKLTAKQVESLKKEYSSNKSTIKEIAEKYGVSITTVRHHAKGLEPRRPKP